MLKLLTPGSSIKELQRQRFTVGFFLKLVNSAYPAFVIASSIIDQCSVDQLMYELVSCLYDDEKAVEKKIGEKLDNAAIIAPSTAQCYLFAIVAVCIQGKKFKNAGWKSSLFKKQLRGEEMFILLTLLEKENNLINVFGLQGQSVKFRDSEAIIKEKNRILNNMEVQDQLNEVMLSDDSIITLLKQDDIWLRSQVEIESIERVFSFYYKIYQEGTPGAWVQRFLKKLNYYN